VTDVSTPWPPDPRFEALIRNFGELSPRDQDLVLALVDRLRTSTDDADASFPPDVPFMDFEE
jgi:hypothetical protein